jgi:hypothetical protein
LECPLCKAAINHWALDALLQPVNKLKEAVEVRARARGWPIFTLLLRRQQQRLPAAG